MSLTPSGAADRRLYRSGPGKSWLTNEPRFYKRDLGISERFPQKTCADFSDSVVGPPQQCSRQLGSVTHRVWWQGNTVATVAADASGGGLAFLQHRTGSPR